MELTHENGGIALKIQQISRFRLGEQGRDAGYQISGVSAQVDSAMESEFTGMYTTLEVGAEPGSMLPYILDAGYNMDGSRFYISQIYAEKDFKGRPTPYVHGLILDEDQMNTGFSEPENFFRFSSDNFRTSCNPQQQGKERLEELNELKKKEIPVLTVQGIREKYHLTDEIYEDLLRHFYETVFSEGMTTLAFGWNQPMASFEEVIKDMMFLAFSAMPSVLRRKLTFSNYQIKGMSTRMFTVVPEKYCENHKGAWFNLVNGNSSQLQEEIEGTGFKTQFITYLVANPEEEGRKFLDYVNWYLQNVYRHPEMKLVTAIANVMTAAFYSYGCGLDDGQPKGKFLETYFRPANAGRILNSLTRVKVDEPGYISELLGVLLERAIKIEARINDVQFKNLQKFYLETDSRQYEKAFVSALATRDQETVKKLFSESLKEESSLKTDNFIAGLLDKISDQKAILTHEVISAIADRYPITESEDLQDFYLNYVDGLYSESLSVEETSRLMRRALDFVRDNQRKPSFERSALYPERQLGQLVKYGLVLDTTILERLLQTCVELGNDYDIGNDILEYYMKVYMDGELKEAVKYYEYLQKYEDAVREEVDRRLLQENSSVQDEHYRIMVLPGLSRRMKEPEDYAEQLTKISAFPVFEHSYREMVLDYEKKAQEYLKETAEALQETGKKSGRQRGEETDAGGADCVVLFRRYEKLREKTVWLFLESEAARKICERLPQNADVPVNPEETCGEILERLRNVYWETVNVNTITPKFFSENREELRCGHEKYKKQEKYHEARLALRSGLKEDPGFRPSVDMLTALTTTECMESLEMADEWVKKVIEKSASWDADMSADVLLLKYYDFANENFKNTEFLKKLTEDQKYELTERDYNLSAVHPELVGKLRHYLKPEKKKKTGKKKKVFFIAAAGAMLLLIIAVIVIVLVLLKGRQGGAGSDGGTMETVVPAVMETETAAGENGATPETAGKIQN